MIDRKQLALNKLRGLGDEVLEPLLQEEVPNIKIPSRGTGNIIYNEEKIISLTVAVILNASSLYSYK